MNHSKSKTFLGVVAIVAVFPCWASGATLNVPGDFATIQGCIDAAQSVVDECVVAPGTYNECINFNGQAITVRSADGPDVTTIDGFGLNCSVVQCVNGESVDTVLQGFTITGGNAVDGGGMFNMNSSPVVDNCIFSGNSATSGGGGMNNVDSSNPRLANCIFASNNGGTSGGGGMWNGLNSNPIVTNCIFVSNASGDLSGGGGGMRNEVNSNPTVTNCTLQWKHDRRHYWRWHT